MFLLIGLQPLEHFGPFSVLKGLPVARALIAVHCCRWSPHVEMNVEIVLEKLKFEKDFRASFRSFTVIDGSLEPFRRGC